MGKASRNRRRAAAVKARRTRSGSPFWYAATGVIIIVGVVAVALSRGGNSEVAPFANSDHWHAALGVNVCGRWLPNVPAFEERAGTTVRAGLHSHGDGLIHIHPYSTDEAGKRATVGLFLKYGGWSASGSELRLWDNQRHENGDKCDGKVAKVRWSVNGKERTGNPAKYQPKNQDVVALAFLPPGQKIGTPPQAKDLATPSDLNPNAQPTAPPGPTATTPGATSAPGATTPTTAAGTPGSTAAPASPPTSAAPTTAAPPTTQPPATSTPSTSAP